MATQPVVKLSLGYSLCYLLPLDAAAKITALLSEAQSVDSGYRSFDDDRPSISYDVVDERPVNFNIAPADGVRISKGDYQALRDADRAAADAAKQMEDQ